MYKNFGREQNETQAECLKFGCYESTFNPRFAYKLQRKSPWDSSTIEMTTIKSSER